MSPLVSAAIAVVEAARALEVHDSHNLPGVYRIGAAGKTLMRALKELAGALEEFDRASGESKDPAVVLAAVMSYAAEKGADIGGMIRAAAEAGMTRADAADIARSLEESEDLKPRPGQIAAPPRKGDETLSQASVRTQAPQPKAGTGVAPKYEVHDRSPDIHYSKEGSRLAEVAAIIGAKPSDPRVAQETYAPTPEHKPAPAIGSADEFSRQIGVMLDQMEAQIKRMLAVAGPTPKLTGLATAIDRTRERVTMEKGIGGTALYRMAAGVVAEINRISEQLKNAEGDLSAEADPDYVRQPRM